MSKYVRQEKSLRKHPVASSSSSLIKAPSVPSAPKERPGWKGPGFIKKAPRQAPRPSSASKTSSSSTAAAPTIQEHHLPIELQQLLLNIFRSTFPVCQDYEALKPVLQSVREALLLQQSSSQKGDAAEEKAAWSREWLEAYVVRWSPNRALCCAAVLLGLCGEFGGEEVWFRELLGGRGGEGEKGEAEGEGAASSEAKSNVTPLRVVSFGGGPSDLMAFGAVLRHLQVSRPETLDMAALSLNPQPLEPKMQLQLLDVANWTPIISSLETGLTTPPTLSKYASATARANNAPFLAPGTLDVVFKQNNILTASHAELSAAIGTEPTLLTLFYVLSELHASSAAKTAAFLLKVTLAAPKDSLLLVIDSQETHSSGGSGGSGDAAERKGDDSGAEKREYPIRYLMDMALLGKQIVDGKDAEPAWEKLVGDENRFFKMEEGLRYPLSLENMRFQMHLFRRR